MITIYLFVFTTLLCLIIFHLFSDEPTFNKKDALNESNDSNELNKSKDDNYMLITRHLQRIDGVDMSTDEGKEWTLLCKNNPEFTRNPYLSKINGADRVTSKIISLKGRPDIIITSPFLRCLETAVLLAKRLNINSKSIYVDFNLGEWNASHLYPTRPYNSMETYNHSLKYIEDELGPVINSSYKGDAYEEIGPYTDRVHKEVIRLGALPQINKFNILLISHSCSTKGLIKSVELGYAMKYEDVIDLSAYC